MTEQNTKQAPASDANRSDDVEAKGALRRLDEN
jgi:hypothetical protein